MRALTISRTEVLRSYRTASLRSYQANSDIMEGWVWHGARDSRECAFCWSQEWSLHGLIEPFASHPRCRCSPIGRTVGWEAILGEKGRGIPDTRPKIEKGEDLFEQLPDERKRAILGLAKFAAYQNGKLKLEDVAGFRRDKKWGPVGYERSLRDILGEKEARKWIAQTVDREAISQRMKEQWASTKMRRSERERQVAAMSDAELIREVQRHQQARWHSVDLLEHVKKHQRDYIEFFGRAVGPKEIEETSRLVMQSWDQIFTSLDGKRRVSYTFASNWEQAQARVFVTISGNGRIKTLIPSQQFARYLGRHPELVEVTERVRKIGG